MPALQPLRLSYSFYFVAQSHRGPAADFAQFIYGKLLSPSLATVLFLHLGNKHRFDCSIPSHSDGPDPVLILVRRGHPIPYLALVHLLYTYSHHKTERDTFVACPAFSLELQLHPFLSAHLT